MVRCGENWSLVHCWYSHYGKQYGGFSKIKNYHMIQQFHFWAYSLRKWNWFPEKYLYSLIYFSITMAKTWKRLTCSLTEEWIKKIAYNIYIHTTFIYMCVYMYIHIYLKQQNVIYPWERMKSSHAKKIVEPWVRYTKQKKSEKDKYVFFLLLK